MKKVLVGAIIAILMTMGFSLMVTEVFGGSAYDASRLLILLLGVFAAVPAAFGYFPATLFSVVMVFSVAAEPNIAGAVKYIAVLMTLLLASREKNKFMFVMVLSVYLIEGAGIYYTWTFESWWPVISAIAVFCCWLLILWRFEKGKQRQLQLASV
jgi:hypothetical protein